MSIKNKQVSFIVEGQNLRKDVSGEQIKLMSGTKGYYTAYFSFSRDWRDFKKVAVYKTKDVIIYEAIVDGVSKIPNDILHGNNFRVSVKGISIDGETELPTNELVIRLSKGGGDA